MKRLTTFFCFILIGMFVVLSALGQANTSTSYRIVDTGQNTSYDDYQSITDPTPGNAFYGQDSNYRGFQATYQDNWDGTISDLNTGLVWQKTPDLENQSTFPEAVEGAGSFDLAGYTDWRLPTIKELYSLMDFTGSSPLRSPYLNTDYFDFVYGDEYVGGRMIDAQYWTATEYVGFTFRGDPTVFGVNFADGRIKGYPRDLGPDGQPATHFVRYVRGNPDYGQNLFSDNNDGTVADAATGLMWQKSDDGTTRNWEDALSYCQTLVLSGSSDWRLPNAKELQSIVDYSRAPDAQKVSQQGPALDPVFDATEMESWYWSSTTLLETPPDRGSGSQAVYLTFGQAFGVIGGSLINVHGAGAQRSDPKTGDPANWPDGNGPQSDQIRIYNYSRCVTDAKVSTDVDLLDEPESRSERKRSRLLQNYPNPFNPGTVISFNLEEPGAVELNVYNMVGQRIATLASGILPGGDHSYNWDASGLPGGVYLYKLVFGDHEQTRAMVLLK